MAVDMPVEPGRQVRAARAFQQGQGITVVLSAWTVAGVFVDGWAHFNRPGLETFFTPWHAILYSGAAALFGWLLLPHRVAARRDRLWAVAAAVVFAAGGLGDLLWHGAFGVETGLDALVSPTHLLLLLGGVLGVTAPLREQQGREPRTLREASPVLAALILATALGAFFLLYVSPFTTAAPTQALLLVPESAPGHAAAEAPAAAGLAAYLVATVLLVVPALLLLARRSLPFGAITLLVTIVATLSAAVTDFGQPAAPAAALLAGLGADAVLYAARNVPAPALFPLIGAAIPLLLWTAQLVSLALTVGVRWPASLVIGAPVLTTMLGAVLGVLASPATHGWSHGAGDPSRRLVAVRR